MSSGLAMQPDPHHKQSEKNPRITVCREERVKFVRQDRAAKWVNGRETRREEKQREGDVAGEEKEEGEKEQ